MPFLMKQRSDVDVTAPTFGARLLPQQVTAGRRVCAAADCAKGWVKPWRNKTRPVFERGWGCSARCQETMVRAAVLREVGDAVAMDGESPHRHRVPLGLVLLAQGWITHPQLQSALAQQRASGQGRIGDWLTEGCGLSEERITRGLGVQWGCPVLSMHGFSPSAMALIMPGCLARQFGVLPLRVTGGTTLYLAFRDQMDAAAALALEQMLGLSVESGLLRGSDFDLAAGRLEEAQGTEVVRMPAVDADAMTQAIMDALSQRLPVASRLVRFRHSYWLRMWLEGSPAEATGGTALRENLVDYIFEPGQPA